MHTVGPGIWRENLKSRKMRNTTLGIEIWQGIKKCGNYRNVHCRTCIMASKLKIMENEKHPLNDLKNDEINKTREK